MKKCKYPNEVCANMTLYHGEVWCDSIPCSLKDELPPRTNADRIRGMSNSELADYLFGVSNHEKPCTVCKTDCDKCYESGECCKSKFREWLEREQEIF